MPSPLALRARVSRNPAAIVSAAVRVQARLYTRLGGCAAATSAAAAAATSSKIHANASARHTAVGVGGIQNASIRNYTSHSQLPSEHQMIYEMCRKFAGMLCTYLRPYNTPVKCAILISVSHHFSFFLQTKSWRQMLANGTRIMLFQPRLLTSWPNSD